MLFGSNLINTGDTVLLKTNLVVKLAVNSKGDNIALDYIITIGLAMLMTIKSHQLMPVASFEILLHLRWVGFSYELISSYSP